MMPFYVKGSNCQKINLAKNRSTRLVCSRQNKRPDPDTDSACSRIDLHATSFRVSNLPIQEPEPRATIRGAD